MDQAFSPSFDLVPPLPPPPLSSEEAQLAVYRKTKKERQLAEGRGEGAKSYAGEKSWSSINHSSVRGRWYYGGCDHVMTCNHHKYKSV